MKGKWKKPAPDTVAGWICGPLLALLGGGLMLLGTLFAWRILWMWGLVGLLPGLLQTVLLLLPSPTRRRERYEQGKQDL